MEVEAEAGSGNLEVEAGEISYTLSKKGLHGDSKFCDERIWKCKWKSGSGSLAPQAKIFGNLEVEIWRSGSGNLEMEVKI